jgi:anthranilate/para-aminobenzoate synthase component II
MGQAAVRNPFFQNFIQNDEILITKTPHIITYQFHPESIGTSFRKELIRKVCSIVGG